MNKLLCSLLLTLLFWPTAMAATPLFDFESDSEIAAWTIRSAKQDSLRLDQSLVPSGNYAACFHSPKWREGMQAWPAFEIQSPIPDWTPYERLAFWVINPTVHLESLRLYITDTRHVIQKGLSHSMTLSPQSVTQVVLPLSSFPKTIDRQSIGAIHFYTSKPKEDFLVLLDGLTLLKAGEGVPKTKPGFEKQMLSLVAPQSAFDAGAALLAQYQDQIDQITAEQPQFRVWSHRFLLPLREALATMETLRKGEDITASQVLEIRQFLDALPFKLTRALALVQLRAQHGPESAYVVGLATSMSKVFPKEMPPVFAPAEQLRIALARHESESFQVVVLPFEKPLEQVKVEVQWDQEEAVQELSASACPVGYVKTSTPPYDTDYIGWWPDPLLDFMESADIEAEVAQAFWVRLRVSKEQRPGVYTGQIVVSSKGETLQCIALTTEVYPFCLPKTSPLPTAMSVYDHYARKLISDWSTMKLVWADFLADYYIDYDSLYRKSAPDKEILARLEKQGRLKTFNLGYFHAGEFSEDDADEAAYRKSMDAVLKRLDKAYALAKEMGILEKAYIYGFDECNEDRFPLLERVSAELKARFPEVPLLTTTRDRSYGMDSVVKSMDGWCPLTPDYDREKVAKARAAGKSVWWYICCGPTHPYANWFVEHPALETRLLMGAMSIKYQPDGFLYYALTRWANNSKVITDGPFTSWNPASYKDFNGDGSMLCPGPEGRPLATIRLENFRDGLEDYAYAALLRESIREQEEKGAGDAAWLAEAKALLEPPKEVLRDLTDFTQDPQKLYAYRNAMAECLRSMGEKAPKDTE